MRALESGVFRTAVVRRSVCLSDEERLTLTTSRSRSRSSSRRGQDDLRATRGRLHGSDKYAESHTILPADKCR